MYMLGHVGVTFFLGFTLNKFSKIDRSKYFTFLVIGSMFPDFIDKPMGSIFFQTGRWFGHSILFLTIIFIIALYFSKGKQFRELELKLIAKVWYIGSLLHLLEDIGISKKVVFWPLFGNIPSGQTTDFLHGFTDLVTVAFEIIGLGLIIIVGINEKWVYRSWKLFFTLILFYLLTFITAYALLVVY